MLQINYQYKGANVGLLSLTRSSMFRNIKDIPTTLSITHNITDKTNQVSQYIKQVYKKTYGATIEVKYPTLLSITNAKGDILAAAGIRSAESKVLFLEQYLEKPVDELLSTPRHEIAEIGNLASNGGGASLYLFATLSAYLHHAGYSKAVMTCTTNLEKRFNKRVILLT